MQGDELAIYSIGAVERMLDIPAATIRNWEERYGLVKPERSDGGHRLYTRGQVEQLRFVKENEQDHDLHRLESWLYHMGSWDVFKYTNDFKDLIDLAGFKDLLVKVMKYQTSLNPAINLAITMSSDLLNLWDYTAWHAHAYQQYESHLHACNAGGSSHQPVAPVHTWLHPA